jgi:hypothetical protein
MKITRRKAVSLINKSGGKIFTVEFVKKDGELRKMNCRREVKKGVKGIGMSYDPEEYSLITVYDLQKAEFRMINKKTLHSLSIGGKHYSIGGA